MANASNYRILIEGRLDPTKIQAEIKALQDKNSILLNVKFKTDDLQKLNDEIAKITSQGNQLTNLKITGDSLGQINHAAIEYLNTNGNIVKTQIDINAQAGKTQTIYQNIAKTDEEILRYQRQQQELQAKQQDEMDRMYNSADRFLAKAKTYPQTQSVQDAIKTAEEMQNIWAKGLSQDNLNKMRDLNNQLSVQKAGLDLSRGSLANWTDSMKRAMQQTISYGLSVGVLYGALAKLREGIQYVIDLNKEMTNIQMVTGESDAQIAKLALGYNRLGKEMSVSTIDIAKGSLEFIRQGKSAEETAILIKNATMMSKLGNIEAAESSEMLTSIMNGYKMEAQETGVVVDKLVAIDNAASTSVQEIATAMRYSSATAQQAGIDFDHLAAYIGTVSAVTRGSAESIGQAMKTVVARMTAIKSMKAFDDEGEAINNVEKSLLRVNVNLRDGEGHFRNLQDVIDELAVRWGEFSKEDQIFIAQQIGGVRQYNMILTLLNNRLETQKQLTAEAKSTNLAEERYAIYQKGIEAAQNRMLVAWQALAQSTTTKSMITDVYNLGAGILEVINAIGGLKTIILVAAAAWAYYNKQAMLSGLTTNAPLIVANIQSLVSFFKLLVLQIKNATAQQWLFNAAAEANPIGLIVVALAAAITAINIYNGALDKAIEKQTQFADNITQSSTKIKSLQDERVKITELYDEFQRLSNITSRSKEEQQQWYDIQSQLKDILPNINGSYNEQGRFIVDNTVKLDALLKLKQKEIELEEKKQQLDAKKGYEEEIELYDKLFEKRKTYVNVLNGTSRYGYGMTDKNGAEKKLEEVNVQIGESEIRIVDFYNHLSESEKKAMLTASKGTEIYRILTDAINAVPSSPTAPSSAPSGSTAPSAPIITEEMKKLQELIVKMIKDRKEQEKDALKKELDGIKELYDKRKQYYDDMYNEQKRLLDEQKIALDREYEDQKRNEDAQKDALEQETESYKNILDAERAILDAERERAKFANEQEDKQAELAKLEGQIAELRYDDTEEGVARRLQLEDQAANLRKEMERDVADEQYRLQSDALDNEAKASEQKQAAREQEIKAEQEQFDWEHELRQRELEDEQRLADQEHDIQIRKLDDEYALREKALQDKIDQIDAYLKQEGTINNDALNMMLDKNSNVYQELIDWNAKYGTGIKDDIVSAWNAALDAIEQYKIAASGVSSVSSLSSGLGSGASDDFGIRHPDGLPTSTGANTGFHYSGRHSGIETGFVGGLPKLKSNEEFAKLLDGEIVVNSQQMDRFMTSILPKIAQATSLLGAGGVQLSMPITVQGNLDRNTLPDIERIANMAVEKINKTLMGRGYNRRADAFGGV